MWVYEMVRVLKILLKENSNRVAYLASQLSEAERSEKGEVSITAGALKCHQVGDRTLE